MRGGGGPEAARGEAAGKVKAGRMLTRKALGALTLRSIFAEALPRVQGAFARRLATQRQLALIEQLSQRAGTSCSRADTTRVARLLESTEKHASDWLHAPLAVEDCKILNGHFRIAVALRLGINPFSNVSPGQRCKWCLEEVGEDALAHSMACTSNGKGNRNRLHQQLQQAWIRLAKQVGRGQVHSAPRLLTLFGAGAHEVGYVHAIKARAREVGSKRETVEQNSRRQLDMGLVGVLGPDTVSAVDFTISDGGGSIDARLPYVPGYLRNKRSKDKHDVYHGPNGRFEGLTKKQLTVPSYDLMGGCTEETEDFTLLLIKAIAAASPGTPYADVARRTRATISCALIAQIAANALDFRNGKLLDTSRRVGDSEPGTGSQGGTRTRAPRGRRRGAARSPEQTDSSDQDFDAASSGGARRGSRAGATAAVQLLRQAIQVPSRDQALPEPTGMSTALASPKVPLPAPALVPAGTGRL